MTITWDKPQDTKRARARSVAEPWWRCRWPLAAGAAVALGFLIRAFYIFTEDFPLNDGGLFFIMTRELQQAHYRLPAFTSYNGANIPFAYPPFGFYLAGLLDDLSPLSLLDVFRFLPLAATSLTVIGIYLLARAMLPSKLAVVVATCAFALTPRSFIWLLMGGGVTRSLGLLFAVFGLWLTYLLYTRHRTRLLLPATLCAVLTVLSHLETGQFLAVSSALLFLAYGRHRRGLLYSLVIAIGTIALTAPWWGTVIAEHGLAPFLAAKDTGRSVFTDPAARNSILYILFRLGDTGEPFFPLPRMLALIGALVVLTDTIVAASRRRFVFPFLPVWWVTLLLVDPRAAATFITVPLSLLAGIAVASVLYPAFRAMPGAVAEATHASAAHNGAAAPGSPWLDRGRVWSTVLLVFLLGYGLVSATIPKRPRAGGEAGVLISLSRDERAAMSWIARQTPTTSRFLVIGGGPWTIDKTAEWFPALAERVSVTTVQGSEWLPNDTFTHLEELNGMAQECAGSDTTCIDLFTATTGLQYDYIYVRLPTPSFWHPANLCCHLATSLLTDTRYTLVYPGPGAMVFARR